MSRPPLLEVIIKQFINFNGDQDIFFRSGHNSHMCLKSVAEKIPNLLISVNDSGYSDHSTLHAAYKELEKVIQRKDLNSPNIVIADGHKLRFGADAMHYCEDTSMDQYLIPPFTSCMTQLHNQMNNRLHQKYEEKKDENLSGCSDMNKAS